MSGLLKSGDEANTQPGVNQMLATAEWCLRSWGALLCGAEVFTVKASEIWCDLD
jgi:hypothetical protein